MGAWYRKFNGEDERINCSIGTCNLTGDFTMAALFRMESFAEGAEPPDTIVVNHSSANQVKINFNLTGADAAQPCAVTLAIAGSGASGDEDTPITATNADGWVILATTKTAGVTVPRFHIYKNGVWSHGDGSAIYGALGNPASQADGSVRFMTFANVLCDPGDLAVAAEWTSALDDGDVEALSTNSRTQDWLDLSPAGCWEFNQSNVSMEVEDLTGNGADQTAIVGTTASYDPDLVWDYKTSSLPDVSPVLPSYVHTAGRGQ